MKYYFIYQFKDNKFSEEPLFKCSCLQYTLSKVIDIAFKHPEKETLLIETIDDTTYKTEIPLYYNDMLLLKSLFEPKKYKITIKDLI